MKKWEKYLKKYNNYQKHQRRTKNKKSSNKQKTFLDKLYIRIFLSSILLFLLLFSKNVLKVNEVNYLNEHMNIFPILKLFTNIYSFSNDISVDVTTNYEFIEYKNGINYIVNESFNGVSSATKGLVVKIIKNNNLYYITIKDEQGFEYTYGELENIDVSLYEYVGTNNIIGTAKKVNNKYCFSITISKEGKSYSVNNLYE